MRTSVHGRTRVAVATGVLAALVAAGCTSRSADGSTVGAAASTSASSPPMAQAAPSGQATPSATTTPRPVTTVTTSVADKATGVAPDRVVTVGVAGAPGRLAGVSLVSAAGKAVPGSLDGAGQRWTARGRLLPATTYTLTATTTAGTGASGSGAAAGAAPVTTRRTFTTLKPKGSLRASIAPLDGSTVGVGMPLIVTFSQPVTNRAAVEKALTVTTSKPVTGSWHWYDSRTVHYRPKTYWPAHTTVRLQADLAGLDAGGGVWGVKNRDVSYTVGRSVVDRVDLEAHTLKVYVEGELVRTLPVTGGKSGFATRSGTKVIMEKFRVKHMDAATTGIDSTDSEYYQVDAPYAMRVTNSGEFLHAAPWSTGSQGDANVSHGCVGMSVADARWLFGVNRVGDVVEVTGSTRKIEPQNGWSDWNGSWASWVAGSALTGRTSPTS